MLILVDQEWEEWKMVRWYALARDASAEMDQGRKLWPISKNADFGIEK
jgi:hypothetical protein